MAKSLRQFALFAKSGQPESGFPVALAKFTLGVQVKYKVYLLVFSEKMHPCLNLRKRARVNLSTKR